MSKLMKSLLIWLFLLPIFAITLFPFYVMATTAIRPQTEVFDQSWLPTRFAWENFVEMWTAVGFGRALANSLYISTLATALTLIIAIPAGYALSRYRFAGRTGFRRFLLISQMLSPIVLVLGLFRVLVLLNALNDAHVVALLYAGFNTAFAVWMLESYFSTIPRDLEMASWMEGASGFTTARKVFLPLAMPAICVTALFTFVNSWNEFVLALTLLRSEENYTLPIQILAIVSGRFSVDWHLVMAAALCATLPVAILFAWMQRYMLRGLTAGAVK
ncbi:carbohydrate ABC transporter permease [Maritalea myrionectae]|uniref:Maltose/maltodextrin transport system permease protein MalG n=1 Tax=Maritalea myrionectae TaxID=454601 RepID=A0A2R4MG50_9HYPH|nr:carbohydrate ABC transporter permease [Maritalea myrionectae]AVX04859.1 putative ABC transporter permease protein AmyC [Maritalea myrionectae]